MPDAEQDAHWVRMGHTVIIGTFTSSFRAHSIVNVKLFSNLVHVAPPRAWTAKIAIVDQRQIQFAVLFGTEKLTLVAQVAEKISIPRDVGDEPPQIALQRAIGLAIPEVECSRLLTQQIIKIGDALRA